MTFALASQFHISLLMWGQYPFSHSVLIVFKCESGSSRFQPGWLRTFVFTFVCSSSVDKVTAGPGDKVSVSGLNNNNTFMGSHQHSTLQPESTTFNTCNIKIYGLFMPSNSYAALPFWPCSYFNLFAKFILELDTKSFTAHICTIVMRSERSDVTMSPCDENHFFTANNYQFTVHWKLREG